MARVEREVDARKAHARGAVEAGSLVDGQRLRARRLVDKIVGAGDQRAGRVRVHRDCGFVLVVLRRCARRATAADDGGRLGKDQRGEHQRSLDRREQCEYTPSHGDFPPIADQGPPAASARLDVVILSGYTAPDGLSLSRPCDLMCGSTGLNSLVGSGGLEPPTSAVFGRERLSKPWPATRGASPACHTRGIGPKACREGRSCGWSPRPPRP